MPGDKAVEEVLEFIWSQREEGSGSVSELLAIEEVAEEADASTLERMQSNGLVKIENA